MKLCLSLSKHDCYLKFWDSYILLDDVDVWIGFVWIVNYVHLKNGEGTYMDSLLINTNVIFIIYGSFSLKQTKFSWLTLQWIELQAQSSLDFYIIKAWPTKSTILRFDEEQLMDTDELMNVTFGSFYWHGT